MQKGCTWNIASMAAACGVAHVEGKATWAAYVCTALFGAMFRHIHMPANMLASIPALPDLKVAVGDDRQGAEQLCWHRFWVAFHLHVGFGSVSMVYLRVLVVLCDDDCNYYLGPVCKGETFVFKIHTACLQDLQILVEYTSPARVDVNSCFYSSWSVFLLRIKLGYRPV